MSSPEKLVETLLGSAKMFRSALESARFDSSDGNLRGFPQECCNHASILFGIYLVDTGLGPSRKITARHSHFAGRRHVWLLHQDTIVDLTADQFAGENQPSVLVCRDSRWHANWKPVRSEECLIDDKYARRMKTGWYESPYQKALCAIRVQKEIA